MIPKKRIRIRKKIKLKLKEITESDFEGLDPLTDYEQILEKLNKLSPLIVSQKPKRKYVRRLKKGESETNPETPQEQIKRLLKLPDKKNQVNQNSIMKYTYLFPDFSKKTRKRKIKIKKEIQDRPKRKYTRRIDQ